MIFFLKKEERIQVIMTEYYMFMEGQESMKFPGKPFLIPVDEVSDEAIDHFFKGCPRLDGTTCLEDLQDEFGVDPIPKEFGKSQIIKGMFYGVYQAIGGLEIGEDGTQCDM